MRLIDILLNVELEGILNANPFYSENDFTNEVSETTYYKFQVIADTWNCSVSRVIQIIEKRHEDLNLPII
jgi:hypothetical protein